MDNANSTDLPDSFAFPNPASIQTIGAFDATYVEHAKRLWDAERENADRIDRRISFLQTGLGVLFGLGLFRIEWFRGVNDVSRVSICVVWGIKVALVFALFSFIAAFADIFGVKSKPNKKAASDELQFDPNQLLSLPQNGDAARKLVFVKIYWAAIYLRGRNAAKTDKLNRGQRFALVGIFLVAVAIMLYILGSEPGI